MYHVLQCDYVTRLHWELEFMTRWLQFDCLLCAIIMRTRQTRWNDFHDIIHLHCLLAEQALSLLTMMQEATFFQLLIFPFSAPSLLSTQKKKKKTSGKKILLKRSGIFFVSLLDATTESNILIRLFLEYFLLITFENFPFLFYSLIDVPGSSWDGKLKYRHI